MDKNIETLTPNGFNIKLNSVALKQDEPIWYGIETPI